ncbi:phosphoribosyltransferase-like protein [Bradyrhizobium canariense]|uniref:phosphoribosyltransferase-like protein n=1 Tax=Bradyrhizobium canariense TaxID=255045 RepID=UPI001B8A452A|nr:hypothetical protein [Bradyrhizobium canariense]MBR0954144.1 hypothetical protein [Bradyrhizobium canariense]
MTVHGVRDSLDQLPKFWSTLHSSVDRFGFDTEYVEKFRPRSSGLRSKYIKDGLWGMMEFAGDELALIDSPLLQRLRRIKQLGLTYLTYPSAEHSRFVHTLGVAHVVKRLIASIAEVSRRENDLKSGGQVYPYYDPTKDSERLVIRSLLHAALLHDCGHLAYSHAGEAAFRTDFDVAKIGGCSVEDFLDLFREQDFASDLSECLSIAIVLSPRFRSFYVKIVGEQDVDARIGEICSFIGGVPHDPRFPGLANIISGAAVDADKIDYINRDARECGIPVGVDVSRVFLNSTLININAEQAHSLSQSRIDRTGVQRFVPGYHFVVNSTGMDTYDELANAKSILYQRVYLHQLTRNAEQILVAAIRTAARSKPSLETNDPADLFTWFPLGDDELLGELLRNVETRQFALRLMSRDLPKRAFAVFRDACEPYVRLNDVFDASDWSRSGDGSRLSELDHQYSRQGVWRLFGQIVPVDPVEQPRRISELTEAIREAARSARNILDGKDPDHDPFIGIAPRVFIKPINEVLVREKNSIGYSAQWTKSEELTAADNVARGIDHFYADREWLDAVAIACIKVLYDFRAKGNEAEIHDTGDGNYEEATFKIIPRMKLRIDDICSRIGVDRQNLIRQLNKVASTGYFEAAIRCVPLEATLETQACDVAERYSKFSGERSWRVTEESAAAFVRQFPVGLRREVFDLLLNGEMLGRGNVREAVDKLCLAFEENHKKKPIICRFSPNSGNLVGMLLEQERRAEYGARGWKFARSLAELEGHLAEGANSAVFVDDQFATGGQAEAQLFHWSGLPREDWPPEIRDEQNIDLTPLPSEVRKLFQNGPVELQFVYGTMAGKKRIESAAAHLGFRGLTAKFANELNPASMQMTKELRGLLENIGQELLRGIRFPDGSPPSADEVARLRADALGYNGVASVMVTPFNVPSHTITAFWCPGVVGGEAWIPLFLRRGYRKHLVYS